MPSSSYTPEITVDELSQESTHSKYKRWRIVMFAIPWLVYVGFYLCRKNFPVAQPAIMQQFGWAKDQIYVISLVYLITYAIGQFVSGMIGDKFGSKKILTIGLAFAIGCNFLFGFQSTILMFAVLYGVNGFAQATGWPLCVKAIANWFSIKERGTMMGWWVSCYTIGDVIAISLAAAAMGSYGWRYSFWVPACVVILILLAVVVGLRNRPEDVDLPSIAEYHGERESAESHKTSEVSIRENVRAVLRNKPIWILGWTYFGLKLARYTFLFWVNVYMVEKLGYRIDQAGFATVIIPLAGFMGSLASGYASDKYFNSRRIPITVVMLLGVVACIILYYHLASSPIASLVVLALLGFMMYGPDALVSGAAAMDFSSRRHASFGVGFVCFLGSVGAIMSSFVGGIISTKFGWGAAFYFVAGVVLCCTILVSTMWNKVGEN